MTNLPLSHHPQRRSSGNAQSRNSTAKAPPRPDGRLGPYLRWSHASPVWDGRGIPFAEFRVGRPDDIAPILAETSQRTGLFCANDVIGLWTLRQSQEAGVEVPGHCLVVGVDDSQDICPFTLPTLSSVPLDFESLLSIAIDQLERMISGRAAEAPAQTGPLPVVLRESTSVAPDCGPLAAAMDYIRRNASRNPGLKAIASAGGIHPRALQRLFRKRLGMTPQMAVTRERLANARTLLAGTRQTIGEISVVCGYASQQRFAAAFRREFGESPGHFRRRLLPAS